MQVRQNFPEQKKMSVCADILTLESYNVLFTGCSRIALVGLVELIDFQHRISAAFAASAVLSAEVLVAASSLQYS